MNALDRHDPLPPVLVLLTVLSGCIDAVSFLGLGHVFTANMTGNVAIIGFAAAGAPGFSVTASVTSLSAFVAGAVVGGRSNTRIGSRRTRVLTALGAEAALLTVAAVTAALVDTGPTRHAVIAIVALAMGLRNATVHGLAEPDLPTTVLTRALTGLVADSTLAGGAHPRVVRRAASVLGIMLGAFLGTLLLRRTGVVRPLLVIAAVAAVTAAGYALYPGSRAAGSPGAGDGRKPG